MKISSQTLSILDSFRCINPNLQVKSGNQLATTNVEKSLVAYYKTEETFPSFAIFDLKEFMDIIGLYKEPEFNFNRDSVNIIEKNRKSNYFFSDPETFKRVPPDSMETPDPKVLFNLSKEDMASMLKAANIFQFKYLTISSNDSGNIVLGTESLDSTDRSSDFNLELDSETDLSNLEFKFILDVDSFKIIPGSYQVQICCEEEIMVAILTNENMPLTYYMLLEESSTFKKLDD